MWSMYGPWTPQPWEMKLSLKNFFARLVGHFCQRCGVVCVTVIYRLKFSQRLCRECWQLLLRHEREEMDTMRPEYDFSNAVRGKYYKEFWKDRKKGEGNEKK